MLSSRSFYCESVSILMSSLCVRYKVLYFIASMPATPRITHVAEKSDEEMGRETLNSGDRETGQSVSNTFVSIMGV